MRERNSHMFVVTAKCQQFYCMCHLAQWWLWNRTYAVSLPGTCVVESGGPSFPHIAPVAGLCERGMRMHLQRRDRKWELVAIAWKLPPNDAASLWVAPCQVQMRDFRHLVRQCAKVDMPLHYSRALSQTITLKVCWLTFIVQNKLMESIALKPCVTLINQNAASERGKYKYYVGIMKDSWASMILQWIGAWTISAIFPCAEENAHICVLFLCIGLRRSFRPLKSVHYMQLVARYPLRLEQPWRYFSSNLVIHTFYRRFITFPPMRSWGCSKSNAWRWSTVANEVWT